MTADVGETAAVSAEEALLHFLYRTPIGLVQTTLDGRIEMINPMSAQLLMPLSTDGGLDNLFDVLDGVVPDLRTRIGSFAPPCGVVVEGLRVSIEDHHQDGTHVYALSILKVDAARLFVTVGDVTAEVRREQASLSARLHDAARVDVLTDMPNRVAATEMIASALSAGTAGRRGRGAVLLVGAERLRQLEESFGHRVREVILEQMAERLRSVLRPSDCVGCAGDADQIAARVDGDEFIVLLQQLADESDATLVAQRVLTALGRPYAIDRSRRLHCAASIGLVMLGRDSGSSDDVLRDASIALGEAKRLGGSRSLRFEPGMRALAVRRGGIEMELRRALAHDELFVVYQPVVPLQASNVAAAPPGVEALVRWRHPVRGVVPPIEFIGVAEETGLIGALGAFVLHTACRQFVEWSRTLGPRAPSTLAVNLSRAQLADPGLLAVVVATLASTGMPAERLQLEVTESLAAQDDGVQAQLHALKRLGLKLALDDFGTGYSSLSSLHLLPVDTVKIDRSFVTLLETSPHHRVLIEATIRVSNSLGMSTVAEGIESDGQATIVRELGCDKGQGYRYSRPLDADDLGAWLATR